MKISNSTVVALDELWAVSDSSGDRSRCSTRSTTRTRRTAGAARRLRAKDRLADAISALPERGARDRALGYEN